MGWPRDVAVVGEAVTVMVADGWNRFTLSVTLAVIGSSRPAASSVAVNVTVLNVGSGSHRAGHENGQRAAVGGQGDREIVAAGVDRGHELVDARRPRRLQDAIDEDRP